MNKCTMEKLFVAIFDKESVPCYYTTEEEGKPTTTTPSSRKGFCNLMENAVDLMQKMCLTKFSSCSSIELSRCLMIVAVNIKLERWNNKELVGKYRQILDLLTDKECHSSVSEFLQKHSSVCMHINQHICKTLLRDKWQDKALTWSLFEWYCYALNFPLLSDYLDVLLPPSLHLVDSFIDSMKINGVKYLTHIMTECGKAELRWYGCSQVIYDALQKLSYSKEPQLVATLHPALIKILTVTDTGEMSSQSDVIYCRLLSDMYLEDKILLRRVYAGSVQRYLDFMKEKVIKHLKQTMKVLLSYAEDSCGPTELTRITILTSIKSLMIYAQPRIHSYHVPLIKTLLQVLVDMVVLNREQEVKQMAVTLIGSILQVIVEKSPALVNGSLDLIISKLTATETDKLLIDSLSAVRLLANNKPEG